MVNQPNVQMDQNYYIAKRLMQCRKFLGMAEAANHKKELLELRTNLQDARNTIDALQAQTNLLILDEAAKKS